MNLKNSSSIEKLEYLSEFDSVFYSNQYEDEFECILKVLIYEQKNIVFSLNQIADSKTFFELYKLAEKQKSEFGTNYLVQLFKQGKFVISRYGNIRNAKDYILNKLNKMTSEKYPVDTKDDEFIFSVLEFDRLYQLEKQDIINEMLPKIYKLMKQTLEINDPSIWDELSPKELEVLTKKEQDNKSYEQLSVVYFAEQNYIRENIQGYLRMLIAINSTLLTDRDIYTKFNYDQDPAKSGSMKTEINRILSYVKDEASKKELKKLCAERNDLSQRSKCIHIIQRDIGNSEACAAINWAYNSLIYFNILQKEKTFNQINYEKYVQSYLAENKLALPDEKKWNWKAIYQVTVGTSKIRIRHPDLGLNWVKFIYFDYLHLTIAARLLVICLCLLLSNFVSDKLDIENWFNAGPFAMFIMSILWMLVLTYITDIVTGWIYKGIGFAGSEQIIPRIKEYKKERNIFKWTKQIAGRAE